jgi:hypothetical protein
MENITACYISRVEKNVVWAKLKEIIIIIAIKQAEEKVFKLNKTASYLWEHCDGKKTAAELIKKLCAEFDVDEATALKDALEFIEKMQNKQLLSLSTVPE